MHSQSVKAIVLFGICGSGKSLMAAALTEIFNEMLGLPVKYIDADDLHSIENRLKMASGNPLSDEDRACWLHLVRRALKESIEQGEIAVLACSALKRTYRQFLKGASDDSIIFIHLRVDSDVITARLKQREHYMPASLVTSQLESLEVSPEDQSVDATRPPTEVLARLLSVLNGKSGIEFSDSKLVHSSLVSRAIERSRELIALKDKENLAALTGYQRTLS